MSELPTTAEAWRQTFPNGIRWPVVQACYDAGLMREERYLHLFGDYSRFVRDYKCNVVPERREQWRCFWEPKFKSSQDAPDALGEAQA
ncbi:hypothetical protein VRM59_004481 [Salmonella enterica]|nr:hypothetical protein [Salmonella enterica]